MPGYTLAQLKFDLLWFADDYGSKIAGDDATTGIITQAINAAVEAVSMRTDSLHVVKLVTVAPQTTGPCWFDSLGTGLLSTLPIVAGGSVLYKINEIRWDTDSAASGQYGEPLTEYSYPELLSAAHGNWDGADVAPDKYAINFATVDPTVVTGQGASVTTHAPLLQVFYHFKPSGTLTNRMLIDGYRTHTPIVATTASTSVFEFPDALHPLVLKHALISLMKADRRYDLAVEEQKEWDKAILEAPAASSTGGRRYGMAQAGGQPNEGPPTGRWG